MAGVDGGLREQNKARTRQRLVEVSLSLFERRGFDEVTVEEIAEAAMVSPRTFYRYFGSKEGVLYDDRDDLAVLHRAIADHPADESPLAAVRAGVLVLARRTAASQDLTRRRIRISQTTASLGTHERTQIQPRWEQALAAAVADRLGVDVDADERPELLAGIGIAVMRSLTASFRTDEGPVDLEALVVDRFALLAELVTGVEDRTPARRPAPRTGTR